MKKLRLFAFLLMTSTMVSAVSPQVVAKDCPTVPDGVKEVVINQNDAYIRKSAKIDGKNNLAYMPQKNDHLEIIDRTPLIKDGNCWYKVKRPEAQKQIPQLELWVADINLKQPFQSSTPISSPSLSPSLSPSSSPSPSAIKLPELQSKIPWGWVLVGVLVGAIAPLSGTFVLVKKINEKLSSQAEKNKSLHEKLAREIDSLQKKIPKSTVPFDYLQRNPRLPTADDNDDFSLNTVTKPFFSGLQHSGRREETNFSRYNPGLQIEDLNQQLQSLQVQYQNLESKISQLQATAPTNIPTHTATTTTTTTSSSSAVTQESDGIIAKFNSLDTKCFRDSRFHPVKLTKESIQGKVSMAAQRTIRFEQAEPAQGTYLEFSANGENWLIPNITSPYFNQILNQLPENQEIFTINTVSGNSQLVKPAKLKPVIGGFWEIAEPGEFGDKTSQKTIQF